MSISSVNVIPITITVSSFLSLTSDLLTRVNALDQNVVLEKAKAILNAMNENMYESFKAFNIL